MQRTALAAKVRGQGCSEAGPEETISGNVYCCFSLCHGAAGEIWEQSVSPLLKFPHKLEMGPKNIYPLNL